MKSAIAVAAIIVIGLPLGILLLLDPQTQADQCGAASGPSSVNGIPSQDLPYFEGAAAQFNLGSNGWAYLAAINDDESTFDTSTLPGVHSGTNSAGAAGPMQLGVGGAAGQTWQAYEGDIPQNLSGGTEPPSVYNEVDAVYAGAAKLAADGAPGDWQKALIAWNDYQPEISFIETHVATWTNEGAAAASGQGTTSGTSTTSAEGVTTSTPPVAVTDSGSCVAINGPTVSGDTSTVESNGLAAIPQGAPAQVQEMLSAGNELINDPYSWGGGHSVAAMTDPPGASADPGEEENGGAGYDCSSATSFVLWGGGLGQSLLGGQVLTSGDFANVGLPGKGQWVTYYWGTSGGEGHVFIEVDGVVMDTVHGSPTFPAGSGPRWQPASEVQFELDTGSFQARHPSGF